MDNEINIESYSKSNKKTVMDLLKNAELPIEDLTDEKMKDFMIARSNSGFIVGVVGVEVYQGAGLLRSLVVHSSYQGTGLGRRLTCKIESFAWQKGVKTLYLLTMTAADFFPKIGYDVIQREGVPTRIRETDEFNNVCPLSAVCLFKALEFA